MRNMESRLERLEAQRRPVFDPRRALVLLTERMEGAPVDPLVADDMAFWGDGGTLGGLMHELYLLPEDDYGQSGETA